LLRAGMISTATGCCVPCVSGPSDCGKNQQLKIDFLTHVTPARLERHVYGTVTANGVPLNFEQKSDPNTRRGH